ncbi:MAG TPA: hypothetical protein VIK84_00695 [Haloplasmataceae bacterium]
MLELIKEIKEILAIIIPVIIGFIVLVSKLTKSTKLKKLAQNLIEVEKITRDYICNAEKFLNYSGQDKKEWVKTKVNQYCIENDIKYEENVIDDIIENLIVLSKTVNKREKDMGGLL